MKVVFDSNIYVSAFAIPGGVAEEALEGAMEGNFQLALSKPILDEVLGVLARKFARDSEQLSRVALFLASIAEIVKPVRRVDVKGDLMVTGDPGMLALGNWNGVAITSLGDFVAALRHHGIRPFPKRGSAVVTNELVNKLRGEAY